MKSIVRLFLFASSVLILCGCSGKWEDYEKTLGYRGPARVNPFLAAEKLLEELGNDAHGAKSLTQLPPHDGVIVISGESGMPSGRAKQLLRWAYSGGHLIYCLGGTQPYNDFESEFGSSIASLVLEEEKDAVLEQLGVTTKRRRAPKDKDEEGGKMADKDESKSGPPATKDESKKKRKKTKEEEEDESWLESKVDLKWNGRTYQLSLGGFQFMEIERKLHSGEFSAGPLKKSLALHLQHGMGQITLLSHARPFRNHWIGEYDHARWLVALVGDQGSKEVVFVASSAGSFLALLWKHGWMALIALTVCLSFWLWQQMPRFGPFADVELDSTRHFASHIGALGQFFWRMRRSALLVKAARDAVWERVRERHRSLDDGSRHMNDLLAQEIARRSGLPAERVSAAFDVQPPDNAHNFVTLMRDLQVIRRTH